MRRLVVVAVFVAAVGALTAAGPKFYPDDPISVDDDAAFDASGAAEQEDSNGYDFVVNTFGTRGERRNVRAMNVNTIDEVPDSTWFTNRIGRREIPLEELVRGPDRGPSVVSLEGWVI